MNIHFSDIFLFPLPTFEHKYLYFLLLTFSKQARYFSWNAFAFLAAQDALMFDILGLNNKLIFWCIQEQLGQILLILPLSLIVFAFY